MADSSHYLCIVLEGVEYLLPSAASAAIEQRDAMRDDAGGGPVVAWRETRQGRWPAYGLDAAFRPARPSRWQRAVFLADAGDPVGLVAEDVRLLGRGEMHIAHFTPLGPPPTPSGHLFNGAWVKEDRVALVLDPGGMRGFLRSLAETAA